MTALLVGALLFEAIWPSVPAWAAPAGAPSEAPPFPPFMLGASYQGPADRAWRMWDDAYFDAKLIGADFARAREANLNVLRIFVQQALVDDIRAAQWSKLDQVLDLADQNKIRLIVTMADYTEWDLGRLVAIDSAVASRYKGRATIAAIDLKNEPRFSDLGVSIYPSGREPAVQRADALKAFKTAVSREELAEYRESTKGQNEVPKRLTDDEAFVYVNMLGAYLRFLDEARAWARANDSTVVAYLRSPDSKDWDALKQILDESLAAWLAPRVEAVRAADPGRTITVGHVDPVLASLPANGKLDYRTFHRYPGASVGAINATMQLFVHIRDTSPGQPLVLGEFGFSNAAVEEQTAADLEGEIVKAVRENGGAGAIKWMLNDFPAGTNPTENAFGMFRADGTGKPVVGAFQAMGTLDLVDVAGAPAQPVVVAAASAPPPEPVAPPVASATNLPPPPSRCANNAAAARRGIGVISYLRIAGTGGEGVFMRRTRRFSDTFIGWPEGTLMEVIGPDTVDDGWRWKEVRDPCGFEGFVPTRYTAPSSGP